MEYKGSFNRGEESVREDCLSYESILFIIMEIRRKNKTLNKERLIFTQAEEKNESFKA